MKLFVYSELNQQQKDYLKRQLPPRLQVIFSADIPKEQWQQTFQVADFIFGNPPAQWFQAPPPALQFWQLESAGFEQYRAIETTATVANMGDFFADACAETMIAGILAFYRGIVPLVKLQTRSQWQGKEVRATLRTLTSKNVLILGAGTIGQALKKMLAGFGCSIKMTARQNPAADIHSLDELYKFIPVADVVINTLPGHLEKYVSAEFLDKMKPGSLYASVGRGNTTDEPALISALQTGKLAGAVLDVTVQEPLPTSSPLWQMENVLLTQHTSGGQENEIEGKIDRFTQNFEKFMNGEKVTCQIKDISRGY